MSLTFITGSDSINLDKVQGMDSIGAQIVGVITGGNSQEALQSRELAKILKAFQLLTPRQDNTPIPVEETVVKFAIGDTQTASTQYLTMISSFRHKPAEGYTVDVFDFTDKDIRQARNLQNGDNTLYLKVLDRTKKAVGAYLNAYLPYSMLSDLLSGCTYRDTIPTLKASGDNKRFWDDFGFARGEFYNNYLLPTATSMQRNHYLTVKGASGTDIKTTDIQRALKLVKDTIHYGIGGGLQTGVLVLGNPFTIQNLSVLYKAPENVDKGIFGQTISMYDAYFKAVEGFHDDFLIFLDMSYQERLLVHGVNIDPAQRGFGLYSKNEMTSFQKFEDFKGSKLFIFEEENLVVHRLSGVVLDINPTRANANGEMSTDSETALNTWITAMRNMYKSTR